MVKYGGWGLLMFLEPLPKCSGGFPYIFLITLHPVTFVPIDDSTLIHKRIFVLGSHQEAFDGITSFEVYLHSIFLASSFRGFHSALYSMAPLCKDFVSGCQSCSSCWFLWAGVFILIFTLLRAQAGYLHLVRTFFKWCSSCCNNSGLEHMVLAPWCRVPITLYLELMAWWLSHCMYKSVCVGFLKTDVVMLPSTPGVNNMSRNGMEPSSLGSSDVNCIFLSMELMWFRKLCCWAALMITRHQHIFSTSMEVVVLYLRLSFQILHVKICHYGTNRRTHSSPFHLFIKFFLEGEISAGQTKLQ